MEATSSGVSASASTRKTGCPPSSVTARMLRWQRLGETADPVARRAGAVLEVRLPTGGWCSRRVRSARGSRTPMLLVRRLDRSVVGTQRASHRELDLPGRRALLHGSPLNSGPQPASMPKASGWRPAIGAPGGVRRRTSTPPWALGGRTARCPGGVRSSSRASRANGSVGAADPRPAATAARARHQAVDRGAHARAAATRGGRASRRGRAGALLPRPHRGVWCAGRAVGQTGCARLPVGIAHHRAG